MTNNVRSEALVRRADNQSQSADALPALIDRATAALDSARSSAEVLEARDMARMAYDAARSFSRIARAKEAHDEVIGAVYRAQADAALIEARAKMRLADEYDAAQERGEVAGHGGDKVSNVAKANVAATAADLGLRRDEVHEARKLRDAEKSDPGKAERVMADMVARGEEPTKAKLRRAMVQEEKATDQPNDDEIARKLRRAFRKLTSQAQEDEYIGLKRANHDERVKGRKLRAEILALKQENDLLRQKDLGRALGNEKRRADAAEGRMREHQANAARLQRQVNAQKAEIERLKKEAENQVIPI